MSGNMQEAWMGQLSIRPRSGAWVDVEVNELNEVETRSHPKMCRVVKIRLA